MPRRPSVKTTPVADSYADKSKERIIEFTSGVPGGPGGLISFRRTDDGGLIVDVYQLDAGVSVNVSPDRL